MSNFIYLGKTSSEKDSEEKTIVQKKTAWSAFIVAAKHLKFLFKFPFVVCFYSLETRRKLALKSLWRFLLFTLLQL